MNDKTKLVKEAKNDKASHCWFAYQKKTRQNGIRRNAIRLNATQPSFCPKNEKKIPGVHYVQKQGSGRSSQYYCSLYQPFARDYAVPKFIRVCSQVTTFLIVGNPGLRGILQVLTRPRATWGAEYGHVSYI